MNAPVSIRIALTLGVLAAIVILSVTPGEILEDDGVFVWIVVVTPTLLQKALHIVAYAALAAMLSWTFRELLPAAAGMVVALFVAAATGASLEWFQTYVPGRFGTLTDVLLNAGGSILGLLASGIIARAETGRAATRARASDGS